MIKLSAVSKKFPGAENDFTALDRINLKFEDGEFAAIVGKSGKIGRAHV